MGFSSTTPPLPWFLQTKNLRRNGPPRPLFTSRSWVYLLKWFRKECAGTQLSLCKLAQWWAESAPSFRPGEAQTQPSCCPAWSLSCVRLSAAPRAVAARLFCPWDSPGESAGGGCRFLLQGIFPTQDQTCTSCVSCIAGRFFPIEPLGKTLTTISVYFEWSLNWLDFACKQLFSRSFCRCCVSITVSVFEEVCLLPSWRTLCRGRLVTVFVPPV